MILWGLHLHIDPVHLVVLHEIDDAFQLSIFPENRADKDAGFFGKFVFIDQFPGFLQVL